MLPVADMGATVTKLLNRLEAVGAPPAITVSIGWDGAQIMANAGDYNKLVKSLPMERITIYRGETLETAGASVRIAVARLQLALKGRTGKRQRKPPTRNHTFRRQAKMEAIARGQSGD